MYCVQFLVFFTIINSLTLSPQSFTYHHILLPNSYSIKTRSPLHSFISLYCTSLHLIQIHFASFTSLCFTSLPFIFDKFSLTSIRFSTIFDDFQHTLFTLIQPNYHFPYPLFKSDWFARENS